MLQFLVLFILRLRDIVWVPQNLKFVWVPQNHVYLQAELRELRIGEATEMTIIHHIRLTNGIGWTEKDS